MRIYTRINLINITILHQRGTRTFMLTSGKVSSLTVNCSALYHTHTRTPCVYTYHACRFACAGQQTNGQKALHAFRRHETRDTTAPHTHTHTHAGYGVLVCENVADACAAYAAAAAAADKVELLKIVQFSAWNRD